MNYIIPKLGDEFAFIGDDFINGIAFVRVSETYTKPYDYVYIEWEHPEDKSHWDTILPHGDFNPTTQNWEFNKYKVIKIESEEQKLFLQIKYNG